MKTTPAHKPWFGTVRLAAGYDRTVKLLHSFATVNGKITPDNNANPIPCEVTGGPRDGSRAWYPAYRITNLRREP